MQTQPQRAEGASAKEFDSFSQLSNCSDTLLEYVVGNNSQLQILHAMNSEITKDYSKVFLYLIEKVI
jgi:hypothetical protein